MIHKRKKSKQETENVRFIQTCHVYTYYLTASFLSTFSMFAVHKCATNLAI